MNSKKIILGTILSLAIFASCSKDDSENSFVSDAKVNATIDGVNEDVFKIIDDQFNEQANPVGSGKSTEVVAPYLPSCATVTTTVTGSTWTRTVVFDNCTLQNGNVLDGTILISGSTNFDTPSQTISYTFENFHHNDILIEGNRTVLRTIQSTEALSTPHPVANMDIDMTATFPNGNVYHRVGNRIREMIEGYQTIHVWVDNVFLVTGNWTTTFPQGTRTTTITTPLRVEMTCPHIVSGVLSIVRNDNTATLDFGNGDCDNEATFTANGNTVTIILGN